MALINHRFVCALPEATNANQIRTSNWNDEHDINNPHGICTEDFNFDAQTPGGTLSAGISNTITLTPVPKGVNGYNTGHYLYVSNGTGTAEAVLITGGTAVSEGTSGTITFTPTYSHSGSWTIESATAGCQEALRSEGSEEGKLVYFPNGEVSTYAPITVDVEHAKIRGSGFSQVRNEVSVMFNVSAGFVEISHLCLVGLRTSASIGIVSNGVQCYFHHLKMITFAGAIKITGGFHNMISYIFARNMLTYGILLEDGVGHSVSFFSIATDTGTFAGATSGSVIVRTEGCMLSHMDILHSSIGILVQALTRNIEWLHVDFSYLDSCIDHSLLIDNSSIYYIRGLAFERVWMATSGYQPNSTIGHGIIIQGSGDIHNIEFANCWVLNHYDELVKLFAGDDVRFVNCRFEGGNQTADVTQDQVYTETTGAVNFAHCEFGNSRLLPEVHRSNLLCAATAGEVIVQDCKFDDTIAAGNRMLSVATAPENIRNYGYNQNLDDVYISTPSGTSITLANGVSFNLTGSTNIATILATWEGRKIRLRNAGSGSITLTAAGNIKTSTIMAVGDTCILEFVYDKWIPYEG